MAPIVPAKKKRPAKAVESGVGPKAKILKGKTGKPRYIQRKNAKPSFKKKIEDLSESDFDSDEDFGLNGPEFGPLSDSATSEEIEENDNKAPPLAYEENASEEDEDTEEDAVEMNEDEEETDDNEDGKPLDKTGKKNVSGNESGSSDEGSSSEEEVPDPEGSVEGDSSEDESEKKPKVATKDPEADERTIFVGNLPCTVGKMKIKKWFSKFGEVDTVRLRCPPIANPALPKKAATIQKNFHTDRTNINAFVKFKKDTSAQKALEANGTQWDDTHNIRVDRASTQKSHDDKKAVFIGNLPFDAEENQIRDIFVDCGDILDIRIVRDRKTNVGKGFAYVNFAERHSVPIALTKNGQNIGKRSIRVNKCNYKGPSGPADKKKLSKSFLNKRKAFIDKIHSKKPKDVGSNVNSKKSEEVASSFQGSQASKREKKLKRKKNQKEKRKEMKKNNLIQVLNSKSKKPKPASS